MKKLIIIAAIALLAAGCAPQSFESYQGKKHNTNRNPGYGYKYSPGDIVYDHATGVTYRIDSIFHTKTNAIGFYEHTKADRLYYATNVSTGELVKGLVEKVLTK